ncbi:MAG TPA: peptidylprolyl isomerase [Bryobacteraceae bacterium]
MFNLFRSRDKLVRITLGAILTVVAVSMCLYLIPGAGTSLGSAGEDPVLAEVGGEKLTASQAEHDFQLTTAAAQIPPELMASYFPQYVESRAMRMAARYQAERMGLTVTDDEILTGIRSTDPQFFPNGQFLKAQFDQFLAERGVTEQQAWDEMKTTMLVRKLENAVVEGIVVTPKEVEDEFKHKYEKAKIQYIAFPRAKFMDQVKPTDQELQNTFTLNRSTYVIPQKSSFQVVVLDQEKVESTIQFTDQDLRRAYAEALDNFRMPERIHVRHILISTEGKSDAEKKTLRAKAEDVLKQAKNGGDWVALAKKYSDDKGNAEQGGDLNWIVRGQMVPEFDAAAFALKPKEISGIVTSQFGYHIIQVLDKEPAKVKPFEEVKDGLAADLRKQQVAQKMQMLGDQIHDALEKNPGAAEEVAKQYGAEVISVTDAKPGQPIPTLGNSPEVEGALASMQPNNVSQLLVLPANRLAVAILKSRTPARQSEFNEVADQVRQAAITAKAQQIAESKAKEAAQRLRAGEDIEKIAKSYKLDVATTNYFGRDDNNVEGLGPAVYVPDAFTQPDGSILGPTMIQNRDVVAKIVGKIEPDPSALGNERAALVDKIKSQKAQAREGLFLDSIFTQLGRQGKAKVYPDAIARATATYQQK